MKETFLHQTAESIIRKIDWQQLSNTTLVLPSHRAGLVLKDELLRLQKEHHQQAVWAPTVRTLQQLQNELSPLYEEDELMTIVRLYRLYRDLANKDENGVAEDLMPLDMFYGWGRQMLADFTNIDASMPAEQVPNFFDNTIAAHELSQLELDEEVEARLCTLINPLYDASEQPVSDSIRAQYKQIWRQLDVLYNRLRAEMTAEQKGYMGLRQRAVIEHWEDESVQAQIQGKTFVFVGFNYLLPVERELMERLQQNGQALFYWDYVPDFQTNEKAFSFAKINSALLGVQNTEYSAQTELPKRVTVMACTSREAQAQYVHRWLQENYTEKGRKVGVVICDETLLESVIYTLPAITLPGEEEPAPVNITKGFPLRHTAIFTRVLSWLYDKKRGDVEQVISPDFIDQLLESLIPEEDSDTTNPLTSSSTNPLTWQELLIMESEYQVRKVANQMRKLVADGLGDVPFTLKLLRMLMRRTMENVTMPFHGEPVTDIQVMGVLETRMLDFDRLLILNVEEGVLPQKQADCSFIPYYLRKAYSMQTSDERATVYAYNFFRLLSRAGYSTLLFTAADGAENSKGMSRFIMQMLVSPEFEVTKKRLEEPSVLKEFDDERLHTEGTSLLSLLTKGENGLLYRADGTEFRLSPSALNTYIACPRKFCLQYIQGKQEPEKEEVRFTPATIGSFVHHMMLYLYRDYLKCVGAKTPLSPDSIEQILNDEGVLETALTKAYEMMNSEWEKNHEGEPNHYEPDKHRPEKTAILQFVRNILLRDKNDAVLGLEIRLLEKWCDFYIDVPEVGRVHTGGIIDRLDWFGTGKDRILRVVDYKSGHYDEKKLSASMASLMENKEAGYIRQTLLYSHAVQVSEKPEQIIEPNLYFCSRALIGQKTTLTLDEQELGNYASVQKDFINALQTKTEEVLTTTSFPPCEEKECAPMCPFLELCHRKVYTID